MLVLFGVLCFYFESHGCSLMFWLFFYFDLFYVNACVFYQRSFAFATLCRKVSDGSFDKVHPGSQRIHSLAVRNLPHGNTQNK